MERPPDSPALCGSTLLHLHKEAMQADRERRTLRGDSPSIRADSRQWDRLRHTFPLASSFLHDIRGLILASCVTAPLQSLPSVTLGAQLCAQRATWTEARWLQLLLKAYGINTFSCRGKSSYTTETCSLSSAVISSLFPQGGMQPHAYLMLVWIQKGKRRVA